MPLHCSAWVLAKSGGIVYTVINHLLLFLEYSNLSHIVTPLLRSTISKLTQIILFSFLNPWFQHEVPYTLFLLTLQASPYCFFFFFNLFIFILFLTVLGLRFCARALSSCGKRGPLFIAVRGLLTAAASPVAGHRLQTRRLSSCGSRAQPLRSMWDLPRPGLEPVSPTLAGRFSTTAPPGKPSLLYFVMTSLHFNLFLRFNSCSLFLAFLFTISSVTSILSSFFSFFSLTRCF